MLEDYSMEKKPSNRSNQPPAKGCGATEGKKAQDAASGNSKQFPRGSRRREPTGASGWGRGDRKPASFQKGRGYDKRPQPRGQYFEGGKANSKVVDEMLVDELGLTYSGGSRGGGGSKRQNLNHLLNFHYAPRGAGAVEEVPPPHVRNTTRWLMSTHKHKYNKEHFLQANCQFVVRSDGDYSLYMGDPDILVDWELIEQIRVLTNETLSCPICLSQPVAGKITRCGHVYCWPCMLHYLALSDKTWRKCPICYEAVHRKDLKSVEVVPHAAHSVGETITFQLMKRERGSLICSPVAQFNDRCNQMLLSVEEQALDTAFSKLLTADNDQVMKIINKEKSELEIEQKENINCPELCFIEQALDLLSQRQTQLESRKNKPEELPTESTTNLDQSDNKDTTESKQSDQAGELAEDMSKITLDSETNTSTRRESENSTDEGTALDEGNRTRYESVSSEGVSSDGGEDMPSNITAEDLEIVNESNLSPDTPLTKYFYFYQAIDGQHVYLHAIDVQILVTMYGSLEQCPPLLTGVIVEKEAGSMTEELRRRLRYLQHLPITSQFEVAEIQLGPPTVTQDIMECFQAQLEARIQRRKKRAREERRLVKRQMADELKQLSGGRPSHSHQWASQRLRIDSFYQFPQCGAEESVVTLDEAQGHQRPASADSSRASSPGPVASALATAASADSLATSPSGPSFAQMLRQGKMAGAPAWPTVSKSNGGGRSSIGRRDSEGEGEGGEEGPPPTSAAHYRQSFRDAFSAPLRTTEPNLPIDEPETNGGNKKKKKKKQVLLFATSLHCNNN
ncbi:RING finger protein 10 [Nilaparvata lugens]|uniref:RING finger protein 10 n=1 Tax=Nilaparvata lugens TaxID=108931 RepID=UPI00193DD1CA|nr:RING finger protein 10 [Nilaparvata lugens]